LSQLQQPTRPAGLITADNELRARSGAVAHHRQQGVINQLGTTIEIRRFKVPVEILVRRGILEKDR
jgi:hypothetical protein